MSKSKKYLLHYIFKNPERNETGEGSIVITQKEYVPITWEVLQDACSIVREQLGFSDTVTIVPVGWQRFEEAEE